MSISLDSRTAAADGSSATPDYLCEVCMQPSKDRTANDTFATVEIPEERLRKRLKLFLKGVSRVPAPLHREKPLAKSLDTQQRLLGRLLRDGAA